MCGIIGSCGRPKTSLRRAHNTVLSALLVADERRGPHATGYYAVFANRHGGMYHVIEKNGVPGHVFVKTASQFKRIVKDGLVPYAFVGHNRFTTHGAASNPINNHPHVSDDGKLAIVHNGVIREYTRLRGEYRLKSECDSEILLRIIEAEKDIKTGIESVFDKCSGFACVVAHLDDQANAVELWGFRDTNPLVWVDTRRVTGNWFFASTKAIWNDAVNKSRLPGGVKRALSDCKVIEVPSYTYFRIDCTKEPYSIVFTPVPHKEKPSGTAWWYGGSYHRSKSDYKSFSERLNNIEDLHEDSTQNNNNLTSNCWLDNDDEDDFDQKLLDIVEPDNDRQEPTTNVPVLLHQVKPHSKDNKYKPRRKNTVDKSAKSKLRHQINEVRSTLKELERISDDDPYVYLSAIRLLEEIDLDLKAFMSDTGCD